MDDSTSDNLSPSGNLEPMLVRVARRLTTQNGEGDSIGMMLKALILIQIVTLDTDNLQNLYHYLW